MNGKIIRCSAILDRMLGQLQTIARELGSLSSHECTDDEWREVERLSAKVARMMNAIRGW